MANSIQSLGIAMAKEYLDEHGDEKKFAYDFDLNTKYSAKDILLDLYTSSKMINKTII